MRIRAIGILCAGAACARAQTAPRPLTLVAGVRINATQPGNQREALLAVGPKGQIVTSMRYFGTKISAFDSTGKPLGWSLATGRAETAEIGVPMGFGWLAADTLWVADPMYQQIVLVDGRGTVLKSIEFPTWIHPSWSERRKYPVFGRMDPLAVYSDQTMLIMPSRPKRLLDTPGYDRAATKLLLTTWDGSIRHTVATLPDKGHRVELAAKGCAHTIGVPFAGVPYWALSPDGKRIAIVQPGTSVADSGTVRVTLLTERGDTVYSRRIPQPASRTVQADVDAFATKIGACGAFTAAELRDSALTRVSAFQSFVNGAKVGRDHSVWVFMRAVEASGERSATVLDARGDVIGRVMVPTNDAPLAVDRDGYWLLEPGRNRAPGEFVRYNVRITSAPPSRTASASGASKPSRP